jgi:hypothetical protein
MKLSQAVVRRANRPLDLTNQTLDGVENSADDGVVVSHLGIGSNASDALELIQPFGVDDAAGLLQSGLSELVVILIVVFRHEAPS